MVGLNFGKKVIDGHILKGPAEPYFELAAVCRRNTEACDAIASEYGVKASLAT